MTEYKILEANSADELSKLVTEALINKYATTGSPIITELFGIAMSAQAVLKFEENYQFK